MGPESKTVEFERAYTDDLKYAVVAFANTDGTMLRITNMIRDAVQPDLTVFTEQADEVPDCGMIQIEGEIQ